MGIKIRQIEDSERSEWDTYVHGHPHASPYHLFGWMAAVETAYNFSKVGLVAENGNRILGVLPFIIFKIPFCKPAFVSLPYCDVGSVLAESESVAEMLLAEAFGMAEKFHASVVELRGDFPVNDYGLEYPVETTENKVRMLLDLPASSDELWGGFKSKLRSQVKKAEGNGLHFEIANEKTDLFYDVFSQNMRDLGSPVHSKKMIEEVVVQYGNYAKLGLVFKGEEPVGTGIILRVGNKVSIPWASSLRSHNKLSPNMLLYWGFLQYASGNGCHLFDFGRSTPGEGTYSFKAQWGAKPVSLVWWEICLHNDHKISEAKAKSFEKKKYRNGIAKIWRKLPVQVANVVGPNLRKYIRL